MKNGGYQRCGEPSPQTPRLKCRRGHGHHSLHAAGVNAFRGVNSFHEWGEEIQGEPVSSVTFRCALSERRKYERIAHGCGVSLGGWVASVMATHVPTTATLTRLGDAVHDRIMELAQ